MLLFITTSSLNSLLPTRALCGWQAAWIIHTCWSRVPLMLRSLR